jgi:hypothetical protein
MYTPYNPNPDPTSNPRLSTVKGAAFSAPAKPWEKGYVHSVDAETYTCSVFTATGRFLTGVPWPVNGGSVHSPKNGDRFAVVYEMGTPLLLPIAADAQAAGVGTDATSRQPLPITPVQNVGAQDAANQGDTNNNVRGARPRDVIGGDWAQVGNLGNLVGVLEGGVTIVKAGDMAQIIASQAQNMLKLIGQNFSLFTGAGSLEFNTDNGKTSMLFKAGADSDSESSPDQENFRIRCEMGDAGELVDFRVTDGRGRNLYRVHVDPDGKVETDATQRTEHVEGDAYDIIGGNLGIIVNGSHEEIVDGSQASTVGAERTLHTSGSHRMYAGNDLSIGALHDVILQTARNMTIGATGDVVGTDPAILFTAANGDVAFNIGDPRAGDTQVRQSGFKVDTVTGSITISAKAGKVSLNSPLPGGVKLGGPVGVSPFSAVLYETLRIFMEQFGALIDTHVHLFPALPIGVPTGPPVLPPWTMSRASLSASQSKFVKLGG